MGGVVVNTTIKLVDDVWLASNRDIPKAVLIDVRDPNSYKEGHLLGSVNLDTSLLTLKKTDKKSIEEYIKHLEIVFSDIGISQDSKAIIYGQQTDTNASNLAWALYFSGHEFVAILDGGINCSGESTSAKAEVLTKTQSYQAKTRFEVLATAKQVLDAIESKSAVIIDDRDIEDYEGLKSSAARKGRIPGAVWWDVKHENSDAKLASIARIKTQFSQIIPDENENIIIYCGSGGRASKTFIALKQVGYRNVKVYPGSWSEWGNQTDLPITSVKQTKTSEVNLLQEY